MWDQVTDHLLEVRRDLALFSLVLPPYHFYNLFMQGNPQEEKVVNR